MKQEHFVNKSLLAKGFKSLQKLQKLDLYRSTPQKDTQTIQDIFTVNFRDLRILKFWGMQMAVVVCFLLYTWFLFVIPNLWGSLVDVPEGPPDAASVASLVQSSLWSYWSLPPPSGLVAIDVWFALGLMAAIDATSTVATFNRSIIDHWHYFVSVRMMALAAMGSILVYVSSTPVGMSCAPPYKILAVMCMGVIYLGIGRALDASHAPPPKRSNNLRYWHLQEYTVALSRANGTWMSAILATAVTGGLGTVLTMLVPPQWSTIIPVLTTGFEAIFLRLNKFGRTPQYTVCAAPIFQAGVCAHWGMKQVLMAPTLALPSWAFVALLFIGRFVLDLHLGTIWRECPEFQWARRSACISTTAMACIFGTLLLLEQENVRIIQYIKPAGLMGCYFLSSLGVAAPAAYLIAFDKTRSSQSPAKEAVTDDEVESAL